MGCFYLTCLSLHVSEINLSIVAPSCLCLCLTFLNKFGYTSCRKHFRLNKLYELSYCSPNSIAFQACLLCSLDKWLPSHVFLLNRIALHCIMSTHASCVVFIKFMHLHCCISFIGTLDIQRVDMKYVTMEPNNKTVNGGSI